MSPADEADETPDLGNAVTRKERETRIQREAREGIDFWRAALSTIVGRRELWAFLQSCHAFEERFACGPNGHPQPDATWYHAGERDTGQRLYRSLFRIDRDAIGKMHDENDPAFAKPKPRKGD